MKKLATIAAIALLTLPALAQDRKVYLDWAPKPDKMKDYAGANKLITRLDDVLARHTGQADWTEEVVQTERYDARWISMAPGTRTRTQFYGDDRTTWVVWGGQIRFTIKGQEPFIATKGFLVQVPLRVPYSMEVVGNEPGLRFEVTRGGGILPSYPVDSRADFGSSPPPPRNGQHYVKVSYPSIPVGGGMGVPIPPATNKGHFHVQNDEFWFILEGKIAYEVEGKGLIVSKAGDVVLALPGRFHRAGWAPGQMDTRLAFNRSPTMQHNYAEDANGTQ